MFFILGEISLGEIEIVRLFIIRSVGVFFKGPTCHKIHLGLCYMLFIFKPIEPLGIVYNVGVWDILQNSTHYNFFMLVVVYNKLPLLKKAKNRLSSL